MGGSSLTDPLHFNRQFLLRSLNNKSGIEQQISTKIVLNFSTGADVFCVGGVGRGGGERQLYTGNLSKLRRMLRGIAGSC